MRKYDNSNMAILELEKGQIEILSQEDRKEYEKIFVECTNERSELIRRLQAAEFSDFCIGAIIATQLISEQNATKRSWNPFK